MKGTSTLHGCVLAHRWFSDGEGWAYHPELATRIRELTESLQSALQNREQLPPNAWQSFRIPTRFGDLWGIQKPDTDCLDLRARGRYPSVLLAVLIPKEKEPPPGWEDSLKQLIPTMRGPGDGFRLAGAKLHEERRAPPWPTRKVIGGFFMLCSIIAGVALFSALKADKYEVRKDEFLKTVEQALSSMQALPEGWPEMRRDAKLKAFFRALGHAPTADLSGDHPDYHFLRVLKKTSETRVDGDRWKDYVGVLNAFAASVSIPDTITVRADGKEVTEFFNRCIESLDYAHWLSRELRTDNSFRVNACTGNNVSPEGVRTAVLRFSSNTDGSSDWVQVAECMQRSLARWHVREVEGEDCVKRPWFVVEMYFAFLNGERFLLTKSAGDTDTGPVGINCAYEDFIERLPKRDLLDDVVYPDVSRSMVEGALTILLRELSQDEKIADQDFRSAIAMIDAQMDYLPWNEARRDALRKERDFVEKTDADRYIQLNKRLEAKEQSGNEIIDAFVNRFLGENRE